MPRDPINKTRYRALRAALLLVGFSSMGGALIVQQLPGVHPAEWGVFLAAALVSFGFLPWVERHRRHGDRVALGRIAQLMIALSSLLILQRLAWSLYGPLMSDPDANLFRPSYAFMPFLYLASMLVMPSRRALRFCWGIWAVTLLVTLPAAWLHAGPDLGREGLVTVLVWLLLANPLFILMMRALPHYEEQLARTNAEMRARAELLARLTESEQRFNLVVDGLQVGVWDSWFVPPERRWWSPRLYELIGYSPQELTPDKNTISSLLHPDDRDRMWAEGRAQLERGDVIDIQFRLRTGHRGYRWFCSHGKAERDAQGRLLRLAGSLMDIHEQRMASESLHSAQTELTRLAYRDTLTELHNRRYFDEHFQREWERARRHHQPLSLLLLDLDHFKAYNDRYGHPAGDACLVRVGRLLTRCVTRPADIVARLGGEEFGIVLPETSAEGAEDVARRIQALLRAETIEHEAASEQAVTFSAGIASIEAPDGPGPAELFEQADRALYEAKRRGRNGIVRHGREGVDGQGQLWPAA